MGEEGKSRKKEMRWEKTEAGYSYFNLEGQGE